MEAWPVGLSEFAFGRLSFDKFEDHCASCRVPAKAAGLSSRLLKKSKKSWVI